MIFNDEYIFADNNMDMSSYFEMLRANLFADGSSHVQLVWSNGILISDSRSFQNVFSVSAEAPEGNTRLF